MENLKSKFFKRYANLPEGTRNEIVVVDKDGEPFTWRSVRIEINNETTKGERLLELLNQLELL